MPAVWAAERDEDLIRDWPRIKKTRRKGAVIIFIDEMGFSFQIRYRHDVGSQGTDTSVGHQGEAEDPRNGHGAIDVKRLGSSAGVNPARRLPGAAVGEYGIDVGDRRSLWPACWW